MGNLSKNFSRSEFECQCGCGFDTVDYELLTALELLREVMGGRSVQVNSGNRCARHNEVIGGAKTSQHIFGKAADVVVRGIHADKVADYFENRYPDRFGIGRYNGRTHIDVRAKKARWDKRGE